MALPRREKHPNRIIAVPCRALRLPGSVTLSSPSSSVVVGGGALVINSSTIDPNDNKQVIVLISGGAAGLVYQVETQATASNGERPVWEYEIAVVDN